MASRSKTRRRAPLMESGTEAALRRRGTELVGLVLLGLAALAATMIFTYSPDDPSLFSATDEAPRNALGLVGDYLRGRDPQWVRKGAGRTARDVMTATPVTAAPDDDLSVAARRMLEAHHKRLPVVADGRPWKYLSDEKFCPISADPITLPSFSIRLPFA